ARRAGRWRAPYRAGAPIGGRARRRDWRRTACPRRAPSAPASQNRPAAPARRRGGRKRRAPPLARRERGAAWSPPRRRAPAPPSSLRFRSRKSARLPHNLPAISTDYTAGQQLGDVARPDRDESLRGHADRLRRLAFLATRHFVSVGEPSAVAGLSFREAVFAF